MSESEIKALVCDLFLGGDQSIEIDSRASLLAEGICDSLGLVQIAAAIEKRVPGLKLRDQEVTPAAFGCIAQMATLVRRRMA